MEGQTEDTVEKDGYYAEKYRPQFHFSPEEKWMNDPNGMVYFDGEYHLFYQYYPDSTVWGPMHWGHAISTDLVHWEHLPIALYPDSLGYIFSGSAVYDSLNTSGLGTNENPPLVAIYTYHDAVLEKEGSDIYQTQGIAYSTDRGRTWTKYDSNPVLKNPGIKDFRDPKVRWHESSEKWVMALAVKDHISFYSSPNLLDWIKESDFGYNLGAHEGVWECPDLFPLNYNGDEKWVLLVSINPGGPYGGSATQYFVGSFDGITFTTDQDSTLWLDHGADNYAGVTWSNVPGEEMIFLGWMSNWAYGQVVPTEKWRSAMTVPRKLSLYQQGEQIRIKSEPVEALNSLRSEATETPDMELTNSEYTLKKSIDLAEINIDVVQASMGVLDFTLENEAGESITWSIDPGKNKVIFDRSKAGNTSFSETFNEAHHAPLIFDPTAFNIRIFKDESSVEIFINNGEQVITELFFSKEPLNKLTIKASGEAQLKNIKIYPVHSIW
nr:glycoside hydrolase family 32 protein [Fulvivirga imtechensis]